MNISPERLLYNLDAKLKHRKMMRPAHYAYGRMFAEFNEYTLAQKDQPADSYVAFDLAGTWKGYFIKYFTDRKVVGRQLEQAVADYELHYRCVLSMGKLGTKDTIALKYPRIDFTEHGVLAPPNMSELSTIDGDDSVDAEESVEVVGKTE